MITEELMIPVIELSFQLGIDYVGKDSSIR